jgi:antirestriction factor ArdC-like protein
MDTTIARIDHRPTFAALLESAVTEPGSIARAYSAFHGFSLGNQLLAAQQCGERGLPLGPLASFQTWKGKGRHVRRGERALWLWMPLTMRRPVTRDDGTEETETFTRFALKPHWFVYAQTEGREIPSPVLPEWGGARPGRPGRRGDPV